MYEFIMEKLPVKQACGYCSKDESRAYLTGIKIEPGNTGKIIATDGHRLFMCPSPVVQAEGDSRPDKDIILRIYGPVGTSKKTPYLHISIGEDGRGLAREVASALIDIPRHDGKKVYSCEVVDAVFPAYEQVLPSCEPVATNRLPLINADYLKQALTDLQKWGGVDMRWESENAPVELKSDHPEGPTVVIMPKRRRD
jgi:DNA polymerase III sliding clamp (beta) subunit (PCNA family)